MKDLRHIREEYISGKLSKDAASNDPIQQFEQWMMEVLDAEIPHPASMTLVSSDKSGKPSARIVLLKEYNEQGFVFYSNYESRKAKEIAENPQVSLLFFWKELERQVRIEVMAKKLNTKQADTYFESRPRKSQISANISKQSTELSSRAFLEKRFKAFEEQNPGKIKRPDFWGGFLVIPDYFEFWQGREDRLHDRISYMLNKHTWSICRLYP